VPWNALDERSKKLIREVMDGRTFVRQMPQQVGYCDPEMYDFMISHPDVVIELWELLGVTNLSLKETGPNKYVLKEGTTSTSQVEVLYRSDSLCIVYALGEYEAPVLRRKIKGDVVIFLKSRYGQDKENRLVVQSDLDAYVRIHNPGAEMLAKMLIPVVGKIADSNFEQAVGFIMNVSEAAQEDFESLVAYARRMKNVRPEVAQEFAFVAESVFDREVDRYITVASATESQSPAAPMPRYASQAGQGGRIQEQVTLPNNLRSSDPPTLPNTISIDERLIPLTASEIRREMPQNHDERAATAGFSLDADEPSGDVSLDALMRSLQEPVASPTVNTNPRDTALPRETTASPPRTLTIVNDGRIMAPIPGRVESSHDVAPNPTSSIPSTPSDRNRVVIRTITPTTSSVVSKETAEQHISPPPPTVPSPTRFGTTTPVIPQQSRTSTHPRTNNTQPSSQ
jgi:hypothetical protein